MTNTIHCGPICNSIALSKVTVLMPVYNAGPPPLRSAYIRIDQNISAGISRCCWLMMDQTITWMKLSIALTTIGAICHESNQERPWHGTPERRFEFMQSEYIIRMDADDTLASRKGFKNRWLYGCNPLPLISVKLWSMIKPQNQKIHPTLEWRVREVKFKLQNTVLATHQQLFQNSINRKLTT